MRLQCSQDASDDLGSSSFRGFNRRNAGIVFTRIADHSQIQNRQTKFDGGAAHDDIIENR